MSTTPAATRLAKLAALAVFAAIINMLCPTPPARAQFARPGELPAIDAGSRAAIVDSITAVIDSVYVLEEPAKRIVAGLRQNLAAGDYDELTDPAEFARRLEQDAQAINHDGHFRIRALPPLDPAVVAGDQDEDPAEVERRRRMRRARNYGFKKAEILVGGVGYVRFDQFARGDEAYEAAAAAMNFVASSNAVILDLRSNGGGSASMIRFLCGYLFAENTHLVNWDSRAPKETIQSYSPDYVPGRRLIEQPVYILTSGRTFSAAEEFTFDLRNLERATVVGDTTGGGGHTVAGYDFSFAGFRVGMRVPHSRAYNPENNEGWEGVGVMPHIAVPAEQALEVAHADALRKLIADETDEGYKAGLEWALQDVDSRANPVEISAKAMKEYVGTYGPRDIFAEAGQLWYQRDDRPRLKLEPMGEDLFRVGDLDYFRLRFERNSGGKIVKIIGVYDNGETDEHTRDGA
jgi:hypothetical protein